MRCARMVPSRCEHPVRGELLLKIVAAMLTAAIRMMNQPRRRLDVTETRKVSFDGMERRRLNNHYITRDFDPGSRTKPFSHTFTVIDHDPL